jgi:methyl-accepting chemotaxis protein
MGVFRDISKDYFSSKEATLVKSVEDQRNKSSLKSVNSCVMVADENNIIVNVNPAAEAMMRNAEQDLRQDLPNFSASSLVGQNIDIFHKNPAHQQRMLAAMSDTFKGQITVGGRTFTLTANPIYGDQNNRLGTVVEWEDITEELENKRKEEERVREEREVAASNSRIKSALDFVTSNVMLADENNTIIYANTSVMSMLRNAESDVRKELPNFNTNTLIGSSIDIFHKNPAHQRSMLSALNSTHNTTIEVGGRTFRLIANPVFDDGKERLGTVVEWNDITEELQFERTVEGVIDASLVGDLESRIDLEGRQGFIAKTASGINQLLDIFNSVITDTAESVGALAEGRLNRRIEQDYQGSFGKLKDDINKTIDRLVEVVSEIRESSHSVKDSAGEISSGNLNLSQRTEEQAASLEETSSAMEEITATVQQNAENSVQANTLARGARDIAENGGSVVGRAIDAMQAINESSKKITDIISVIDEIAFQTNLLALNAAVEAARAGDQGRGFAVVADEVRSLAGRSATAAKEIKELIKDSSNKVNEGSELVNQSGETLDEIVTAVKKVNDIVAEIATASDEQSTGLGEISRAVTEMDAMTQQNAALVEEAAAASESMSAQADNLDNLIAFFVLDSQSHGGSHRQAPLRPGTAKPASTHLSGAMSGAKTGAGSGAIAKPGRKPEASKAQAKSAELSKDESGDWEVF